MTRINQKPATFFHPHEIIPFAGPKYRYLGPASHRKKAISFTSARLPQKLFRPAGRKPENEILIRTRQQQIMSSVDWKITGINRRDKIVSLISMDGRQDRILLGMAEMREVYQNQIVKRPQAPSQTYHERLKEFLRTIPASAACAIELLSTANEKEHREIINQLYPLDMASLDNETANTLFDFLAKRTISNDWEETTLTLALAGQIYPKLTTSNVELFWKWLSLNFSAATSSKHLYKQAIQSHFGDLLVLPEKTIERTVERFYFQTHNQMSLLEIYSKNWEEIPYVIKVVILQHVSRQLIECSSTHEKNKLVEFIETYSDELDIETLGRLIHKHISLCAEIPLPDKIQLGPIHLWLKLAREKGPDLISDIFLNIKKQNGLLQLFGSSLNLSDITFKEAHPQTLFNTMLQIPPHESGFNVQMIKNLSLVVLRIKQLTPAHSEQLIKWLGIFWKAITISSTKLPLDIITSFLARIHPEYKTRLVLKLVEMGETSPLANELKKQLDAALLKLTIKPADQDTAKALMEASIKSPEKSFLQQVAINWDIHSSATADTNKLFWRLLALPSDAKIIEKNIHDINVSELLKLVETKSANGTRQERRLVALALQTNYLALSLTEKIKLLVQCVHDKQDRLDPVFLQTGFRLIKRNPAASTTQMTEMLDQGINENFIYMLAPFLAAPLPSGLLAKTRAHLHDQRKLIPPAIYLTQISYLKDQLNPDELVDALEHLSGIDPLYLLEETDKVNQILTRIPYGIVLKLLLSIVSKIGQINTLHHYKGLASIIKAFAEQTRNYQNVEINSLIAKLIHLADSDSIATQNAGASPEHISARNELATLKKIVFDEMTSTHFLESFSADGTRGVIWFMLSSKLGRDRLIQLVNHENPQIKATARELFLALPAELAADRSILLQLIEEITFSSSEPEDEAFVLAYLNQHPVSPAFFMNRFHPSRFGMTPKAIRQALINNLRIASTTSESDDLLAITSMLFLCQSTDTELLASIHDYFMSVATQHRDKENLLIKVSMALRKISGQAKSSLKGWISRLFDDMKNGDAPTRVLWLKTVLANQAIPLSDGEISAILIREDESTITLLRHTYRQDTYHKMKPFFKNIIALGTSKSALIREAALHFFTASSELHHIASAEEKNDIYQLFQSSRLDKDSQVRLVASKFFNGHNLRTKSHLINRTLLVQQSIVLLADPNPEIKTYTLELISWILAEANEDDYTGIVIQLIQILPTLSVKNRMKMGWMIQHSFLNERRTTLDRLRTVIGSIDGIDSKLVVAINIFLDDKKIADSKDSLRGLMEMSILSITHPALNTILPKFMAEIPDAHKTKRRYLDTLRKLISLIKELSPIEIEKMIKKIGGLNLADAYLTVINELTSSICHKLNMSGAIQEKFRAHFAEHQSGWFNRDFFPLLLKMSQYLTPVGLAALKDYVIMISASRVDSKGRLFLDQRYAAMKNYIEKVLLDKWSEDWSQQIVERRDFVPFGGKAPVFRAEAAFVTDLAKIVGVEQTRFIEPDFLPWRDEIENEFDENSPPPLDGILDEAALIAAQIMKGEKIDIESLKALKAKIENSTLQGAFRSIIAPLGGHIDDILAIESEVNEIHNSSIHITDDPTIMIRMGMEPEMSCQRAHERTENNKRGELVTRLLHGQFKLAQFKIDGHLYGRTLLELALVGNKPVLLVEQLYDSKMLTSAQRGKFKTAIIAYAYKQLGLNSDSVIISPMFDELNMDLAEDVKVLPHDYFMYRDSFGDNPVTKITATQP